MGYSESDSTILLEFGKLENRQMKSVMTSSNNEQQTSVSTTIFISFINGCRNYQKKISENLFSSTQIWNFMRKIILNLNSFKNILYCHSWKWNQNCWKNTKICCLNILISSEVFSIHWRCKHLLINWWSKGIDEM